MENYLNYFLTSCSNDNFNLPIQPNDISNFTSSLTHINHQFCSYIYAQRGVYDIMLIASTPNNCIDTFILSAAVEEKSERGVKILNAFTSNIGGTNGVFYTSGSTK